MTCSIRSSARAEAEVAKRNPDFSASEHRRIAETIAVAAVRYFMVKYSRTKIIAFDIDEALAFEGESGPYLQYAVVRAQNIFAKLRDRDGLDEAAVFERLASAAPAELIGEGGSHELWALILEASRLDEIVEQVVRTLGIFGAGEIRLWSGADVQRVLPPVFDPQ